MVLSLAASVPFPATSHAQEGPALRGEVDEGAGPHRLTVLVRSESGELVRGAIVRLMTADRASVSASVLVEVGEGRYESDEVEDGRYELVAEALGYETARRPVELDGSGISITMTVGVQPVAVADVIAAVIRPDAGAMPGHATSHIPLDGGPRTLADRLAEEPGVQVRPSVGGGQVGTVRGSRPEGLLVLLDGLPVNDPLGGSADLSRIPVATLSAATLVRGASPRFGSGAIAGVLLLESRRPGGMSAAGGLEVGSFGRLAADGYASVGGELGTLAAGFRMEGIENDYEYPNRLLSGNPVEIRENADAEGLHLWLSGAPAALPVFAQLRYDDVERGAPGRMGTQALDEARYTDRSLQALLGYGSSTGRVTGTMVRRDILYRDPRRSEESTQSLTSLRLAGSGWLPGLGLELSSYLAREAVSEAGTADRPVRWSGGVWLGRTFETGRLSVQPGVATDLSNDGSAVNPEIALAAQLGPAWTLWGRAGSAYRLPSFADLYAASARSIQANPNLGPERVVIDAEAGVSWTSSAGTDADDGGSARGGLDVQAVAFFRRTNDPIVWVASAVALWSPRNLDRLTAAGLEIRGDVPLGDRGPRAGGSFTFQRSRLGFGDNRNPMPYQPDFAGDIYIGGVVARIWLRGAVRIEGSRTTTLAGVRRLPAYAVARFDASRGFRIGALALEAALAIDNLFAVRYELIELYPEPGRSLLFRLELRR
jgi:outer membrane receptor protein involved in Fe transport